MYISTRGNAPELDFEQVTLAGLAIDGGLYVPKAWPKLSHDEIQALSGLDYPQLAVAILSKFTGGTLTEARLTDLVTQAYQSFHHQAIVPLKQLDSQLFFMELFHGPTLAFKDCALQVLGQLFNEFLSRQNRQATIVGATSGDTGSAAIAGVSGIDRVQLFMLHPQGRVSEVQRRQMTTVHEPNIHNIAIDGNFDDCQNIVKALFANHEFRENHQLSAVNSINWARIASQVVYYFRAALALGAPHRAINFSVPTGNFGNILAGYIARNMGLPIDRLIIGSNSNDILTRFVQTGSMSAKKVVPTLTPSMDIQISSNFERYLFELFNRDSDRVNQVMAAFKQDGEFSIGNNELEHMRQLFGAYRFTNQEISSAIRTLYNTTGEIIDPHSMIGILAAMQENTDAPTVVLGTAHPAKFPDAIEQSIERRPDLPAHVAPIMLKEEKFTTLNNSTNDVRSYIESINNRS